ncbi:hypothetical protein C8J57DRAFT_1146982 [Mycena rebaudengoi]|nr:hypothetical protein C8J57DRAFT_1146982 [Mycena rebaudengoi]
MAAAFSVGSLGDILATAQLAYKLSQILSDSVGSSMEYQELIIELDALGNALKGLDHIVEKHVIRQSVRNAIEHSLFRCRDLTNVFLDRIKNYKPALQKGGSGSSWRDNWRKIGWHIFRKEELVGLRLKLAEQKATINMMLSMSHMTSLDRIEELARTMANATINSAEETPPNIEGYMDEFAKSMGSEVRVLLGEVGQLREERRTLQFEVSELLAAKTLHSASSSQDGIDPVSAARMELSAILSLKSKYGAGGEFEPDCKPPSDAPGRPPLDPPVTSWATWQHDPDAAPTPPFSPPLVPDRESPGLFGPRF